MGTKEKLIERFKRLPADFTFEEAESMLHSFGYVKCEKGRTSGSRVIFRNRNKRPIMLHRPHPQKTLKGYAVRQLPADLIDRGFIQK